MYARPIFAVAFAALLGAAPARAADVTVLAWAQNTAPGSSTVRLPRTGSFTMPTVDSGYLAVAVAISDISYAGDTVTWTSTAPGGSTQSFHVGASREGGDSQACRSQIWVLPGPAAGPGFATVTVRANAGSPPPPSLAAAIFAFANVAGTWTNGPCCVNVANSGTGTDTINKTVAGTSRGDALINSVCTGWKGTAPGTPGPDPNNDPEMVPRTFQTVASAGLQHFTGTSPGPLVERPMTSYRHLRWLQSGSRSWTIVGLGLLATTDAPDAAAPPPMPDAAAPPAPDAAATAPDTTAPPPPDAGAPLPPDITPAPALDAAAPPADLAPAPPAARDGGAEPDLESEPDADPGQRQIALQVGCACRLGSAPPGSALPLVLLLPLLLRRRR